MNIKQKIREVSETIIKEMGPANDTHYWLFTILDPKTEQHSTCSNLTKSEHVARLLEHIIWCMKYDKTTEQLRDFDSNKDN